MLPFFNNHNATIFTATRSERADSIERLIEQGTMRSGYYLLLLLATCIVTPGLLLKNVSVVIGGMILAPLLIPLLSLSLSLVVGNLSGCMRSLRILVISVAIVLVSSIGIVLVMSESYDYATWYPQEISPAVYIFIAFCSGVAGALAWVKEHLSSSIAGVATAVALLPPLCTVGIGIAVGDVTLMQKSLSIFIANLLGITLAAFIVFWVLGFLHDGKQEEKALKRSQED